MQRCKLCHTIFEHNGYVCRPKCGVNVSDITMCKGKGCPIKKDCYRYTAKQDQMQSYFVKEPFEKGGCSFYWGQGNKWVMSLLEEATKESKRLVEGMKKKGKKS